ncbi:TonB-dependent receptor plug domain-containing protein, partial [Azospirillum brasilense]|nr:TonB-dependent receptor plug domain-containing protein [Azospirillum brasilense]
LRCPTRGRPPLGPPPRAPPDAAEVSSGPPIPVRGQTSVTGAVPTNATGFTSLAAPGNGGSSLATRGFSGHGSVMQLHDGTRLYVGSGTVTFPFDTWSTERIEVLRGPASVLYGEGAIGGVVNVVPKRPTTDVRNEAMVAIGTDAQRRAAFGSGGPPSETLSYRPRGGGNRAHGRGYPGATRNPPPFGGGAVPGPPDRSPPPPPRFCAPPPPRDFR